MSWTETHERYRIIREVVTAAEKDHTGTLPWRDEYATMFGSPDGLVAALRARWQRTCEAQLEASMSDDEIQTRHRELLLEHAGVLRILDRYVAVAPRPAAHLSPVA
ncbi:MAG TPA: hypothetical protein VFO49_10755 [Nocardioides sp.]|nr:hypothetical protein [Nocardioides sp.]